MKGDKTNTLNMNWPITITSLVIVFTFVFFMVVRPVQALNGVNAAFNVATQVFGAPLMIFTFVTTLLAIYLAFGKYRHIKIGDGEPEYSKRSYIVMMAMAALASAALYWSFTEWGYYYMSPGILIEPYSVAAAEVSLGYSFFHWGFATQGPYVLTGVAIGYAVYNKKVKFMKVSTVCEEMMGDFKYKKALGKIIDLTVIFCIIGALGCTLGLAVPLGTGALKQAFGIETTFPVQVMVVLVIAILFTFTSFVGMKKGMKNLSNFAVGLCICFLAYVLVAGPTMFIIKNFFSSLGWMANEYVRMSFFLDPVARSGFTESWTIFFQAFCLTYTAMMGIFVAKVSKGRTIQEISLCCMLGVSGGVWVLFGIDGGFAMYNELNGVISTTEILQSGAGQDSIYGLIAAALPGGIKFIPIVLMVIIVGFVATSLDSASFSLSQTTTVKLDAKGDVSRGLRVFWCVILTLVPLSIMFAKADFSALKSLAILVSIPFMFVVVFMEIVLFCWLKEHKEAEDQEMARKLAKLDQIAD